MRALRSLRKSSQITLRMTSSPRPRSLFTSFGNFAFTASRTWQIADICFPKKSISTNLFNSSYASLTNFSILGRPGFFPAISGNMAGGGAICNGAIFSENVESDLTGIIRTATYSSPCPDIEELSQSGSPSQISIGISTGKSPCFRGSTYPTATNSPLSMRTSRQSRISSRTSERAR